ncbi:MAG: cytochrome c3 family protein [Planctomycetota bacterium]
MGLERAGLLGSVAATLALALACSSSRDAEQPIAFVHKVHVAEEEIPCTDCHSGAEEADHATIPGTGECEACHDEAIDGSPEETKLARFLEREEEIPWKRVHKLHEHVRFSHRRHVVAGQILCERCHGNVAELALPFSRPFVNFNGEIGMERCVGCHLESGNPRASIDCALCHR